MDGIEWNMDAKINEQVKNKKQDNLITAEIRYKMTAKGMMITEYYGADTCVVLPDEIEGETVTTLDDYAFARNLEVEEIWLPEALKEVRILPVQELEKTDSGESTARYGWRCIDGLSSGRSGDIFP